MRTGRVLLALSVVLATALVATSPSPPLLSPSQTALSRGTIQTALPPTLSTPTSQPMPTVTPSPNPLGTDLMPLLDQQERVFTATVTRMEWLFNVLVATIAIAGLLVTLLGVGFMSRAIESAANAWLERNAATTFQQRLDNAVADIEKRYDDKFAQLYRRIDDAFPGERKS